MLQTQLGFVPVISSAKTSCLTAASLSASGISALSCHLADVLVKPGFNLLKELKNLQSYYAWTGPLVLNAASLESSSNSQRLKLRSSYDGSFIEEDWQSILELILDLGPQCLILPASIYAAHPDFSAAYQGRLWLSGAGKADFDQWQYHVDPPATAIGPGDYVYLSHTRSGLVRQFSVAAIESAAPIEDAVAGLVYHPEGAFQIQDLEQLTHFSRLDEACGCEPCRSQMSRAYLQHLYQQTPLLCQRYLVQHNLRQYAKVITAE